ncbi:pectinesterase family protein [Hymenobacter sp. BT175]|uniref:pectinesterase family protein n=1 Tax=Hymenobacter translucens TaxID=2886507 RepID=UPI001D0DDEE4|nr:pectinesterase family protein [Hymenobacter translucens]MCC2548057.1 pectinesterase family protein [Hymenobacter translucens]
MTKNCTPAGTQPAWRPLTLLSVLLMLLLSITARAQTYDAVVAKDGTGMFTSVQAAVNAAPTGRTTPYTIFIKNGKYKEKINVPSNKPFLQFIGESVANTILTFDDFSGKPMPGGGTYGTANSASVTISAANFTALNITFENTTGDAPQALALNVTADRAIFKNCRFLGGQDTVLAHGNGMKQYFKDCYIDGTVDFIFGSSTAVFENSVIYPKTRRDNSSLGYITAANTPQGQQYGYVFRNCIIPDNHGFTTYTLGRPWQNDAGSTAASRSNTKVVWLKTKMGSNIIRPVGWSAWDAGTLTSAITYAEFQSRHFDGRLVNVSQRVPWSIQLTPADTAAYTRAAVLGTWDPCATAGICGTTTPDIAVANFRGVKGASTTAFTWNLSWAISQVKFELYRSATRRGTYTKLSEVIAPNDTTYNYQASDALPAAGAAYYYYLRTSKAGLATQITDTVEISRVPTVTTTGSLNGFMQYSNGPSAPKTYVLSGVNLTNNVTITPPAGYEVSANGGTNWSTSATPLVIAQVNNTVPNTTISVRLNASAAGNYAGDITHTSTGAATTVVAVSGTKVNTPQPISDPLQWWPMTRNNQDSTAVRASSVAASTPTFRKFQISSGSAAATIPPYSNRYGQAFAPVADGAWTTALGGNGGNLNRTYYEQFTVTATANTRLDSLLLTSYVTGSTSNTKLAVVWSRSGFATDSADVTGGKGPGGILLSTANGGFTTPIFLTSQATYRLAFNGAAGLLLTPGQRLTFRTYFSCGSTTVTTRFATLKNVIVKGEANIVTGTHAAKAHAAGLQVYPNPAQAAVTVQHPKAGAGDFISVYAYDGRKLATFPAQIGAEQTVLELSGLAKGAYLLRYSSAKQSVTTTIVKQ